MCVCGRKGGEKCIGANVVSTEFKKVYQKRVCTLAVHGVEGTVCVCGG